MATTFNPFQEFMTLRDAMNQLFQQSFVDPGRFLAGGGSGGSGGTSARALPLEIYQTPEDVVVKALLPGVSPENLQVTYEQGVLTLQAMSEPPKAHDNWTWHLREFGYGRFARAVSLPAQIDVDRAQATFENGILTLTLPKAAVAKPRQIRINPQAQLGTGDPQHGASWSAAASGTDAGATAGTHSGSTAGSGS